MVTARIRRPDGRIQFDASALTFQLVGKGSVNVQGKVAGNTTPGSALIPIPSASATRVLAVAAPFFTAKAGTTQINGQTYAHYACSVASGTVSYWMFDLSSNMPRSPGGLTLRNPQTGAIIYSSDYDVFRVVDRLTSVGDSRSLDASRTYAVAQQDFAGHRRPLAPGSYFLNGQEIIWDGTPQGRDSSWSYQNDGKLYGTRVSGGSISSAEVSWDDVRGQLGFGPTPPDYPPDWTRPLGNALIVDVTGL